MPDWDNQKGGQIFEQMLTKANGKIDGVLAANDGLGGAAIAVLKKNNLPDPGDRPGRHRPRVCRTSSRGDQCMTVYKAVKTEAKAAADAAIALLSGPGAGHERRHGPRRHRQPRRPVRAARPAVAIYKDNVKDVIADGFVKKSDVCTADLRGAARTPASPDARPDGAHGPARPARAPASHASGRHRADPADDHRAAGTARDVEQRT